MSDSNNNPSFENSNRIDVTDQQTDFGTHILSIPTGKLDADQYMVDDLDGVTESLFGSGNMNFLMMQASQTNEAIKNTSGTAFDHAGDSPLSSSSQAPLSGGRLAGTTGNEGIENLGIRTASGKAGTTADALESGATGNNVTALGSLGASALSANSGQGGPQSFSAVRNYSDTGATENSPPPQDGRNGQNGTDGTNGTDGSNGGGDGGTTIINIDDSVTEIIENVTENITDITEDVADIVENITNNTTDLLTTVTENVFNTVNNILDGGLPELPPIGLDLLLSLDDLAGLTLDIFSGNTVIELIDETLDLSPVTNITDGLLDLTSGLGLNAMLHPLTYDNDPSDTDLGLLADLPLLPGLDLDVPLDPVELLVGDLDIGLDLTGDLLGGLVGGDEADTDIALGTGVELLDNTLLDDSLNIVVNPVENLLGDIDVGIDPSIDLFGHSETDNSAGDSDIVIPLDIDLVDSGLFNDVLDISLDPVETLTGDIDLDITAAADLLGDVAGGLIDNETGGDGQNGVLSFLGDTAENIVSDIVPGPAADDTDLNLDIAAALFDAPLLGNAGELNLDLVEDLAGDLDIALSPVADLFSGQDGATGDTGDLFAPIDLDFIDHDAADAGLNILTDPVENLLGSDIGLSAIVSGDVLGDSADALLDAASGGSVDETLLSGTGDFLSDITGEIVFEQHTDFADDLLSAIDGTVDQAINLLDSHTGDSGFLDLSVLSADEAQDLLPAWTESVLPDAGDMLGGGLADDIGAILPDPVTAVTDMAAATSNLLGGLGGGEKHFGGLFG